MNVELKGVLKLINAEEKISDSLSKKEIVVTIEHDTQYPQDISCQAINQRIDLIKDFQMGDFVTVSCNLRGKESNNGKYFNQLQIWAIKKDLQ